MSCEGTALAEKKWHFEFYEEERGGWFLRIDSVEDIILYMAQCEMLDKDKAHYKTLESSPNCHDDHTLVSHTAFGGFVGRIKRDTGVETDEAYDLIKCIQAGSMLKVMESSGHTLLVNNKGGFKIKREDVKPKASVWRSELQFPHYYTSDIRIKRFDDGKHYYAYIGDTQVKDGDVLKWDTYDEAYDHAKQFAADWRRQHLNQ